MLYAIIGVLANGLLLGVSASDIEMWVGVICSCVITVITCAIEVVNLIKAAKDSSKNNSEDAPEDTPEDTPEDSSDDGPDAEGDDGKE